MGQNAFPARIQTHVWITREWNQLRLMFNKALIQFVICWSFLSKDIMYQMNMIKQSSFFYFSQKWVYCSSHWQNFFVPLAQNACHWDLGVLSHAQNYVQILLISRILFKLKPELNIRQSQDQWPNSSFKLLWAIQEDADSLTHVVGFPDIMTHYCSWKTLMCVVVTSRFER